MGLLLAARFLSDLVYQLPASVSPSGTSTIPVLLPFEHGAALPGLSAEASPNEACVCLGVTCQVVITGAEGCQGSVCIPKS